MSNEAISVSVIVRTKDRPQLLTEAILSVLAQSYRPIELVIINDGGSDVHDLLQELLASHHEVSLIYLHNHISVGRSQAANMGLDAANGQFSLFLDDDDYLDADHIQGLISAHCKHPYDAASKLGAFHCRARAVACKNSSEQIISIQGGTLGEYQLFYQNIMPILTVLFPTRIRDLGVRFDQSLDLFEDWDFWLQLQQHCHFIFVDQLSCAYRIHQASSGVREQKQRNQAYSDIYEKWLPTMSQNAMTAMLISSHQWHENVITSIQSRNDEELNRIGALHSFALETIAQKDKDTEQLVQLYKKIEHELIELRITHRHTQDALEQMSKQRNFANKKLRYLRRLSPIYILPRLLKWLFSNRH